MDAVRSWMGAGSGRRLAGAVLIALAGLAAGCGGEATPPPLPGGGPDARPDTGTPDTAAPEHGTAAHPDGSRGNAPDAVGGGGGDAQEPIAHTDSGPDAVPDAAPDAASDAVPEDTGPPEPAEASLALNEVVYAPAEGGSDWVEVHAHGQGEVDLSAYTLVDSAPAHLPFPLPAVRLRAGEFLVIPREATEGDGGFPFGLGRTDSLTLARGDEVVDHVAWVEGDAPEGTSFGRLPDGTGPWRTTAPTPGGPNLPAGEIVPPDAALWPEDRVLDIRIDVAPEAWAAILADPLAEEYQHATLTVDGVVLEDVGVRVKGRSSLRTVVEMGSDRFSFKVDLDRFVPDNRLLGHRKLDLDNGFKDPTLLREALAYATMREFGLPAPRTAFADLWVAGNHMGLYTLVEHVDRGFLDRHFPDDGGDLYKLEPPAGSLRWLGGDILAYRGAELQTNEDSSDHSAFLDLVRTLNHGAAPEYEGVLDVDLALRYLAANTVLVNLDSYLGMSHNYYLYEQDGVFSIIPWDTNEAFGNFPCRCDRAGLIHLRIDEPTCGAVQDRPLVHRLLAVREYRDAYHAHLRAFLDGPFDPAAMEERILRMADLVRPHVEADQRKFFSTADFERGLREDLQYRGQTVIGLMAFVQERRASIEAQLSGQIPATNGGQGSCQNAGLPPASPCGDGVCDAAERANPNLCPRDCQA